jgi:hypothetical protein
VLVRLAAVILVGIALSACDGSVAGSLRTAVSGEPFHGSFCGPGNPKVTATDPAAMLQQLQAIQAVDDLDELCKRHDSCYVANPSDTTRCDFLFVRALRRDQWSTGCQNIVNIMLTGFPNVENAVEADLKEQKTYVPERASVRAIRYGGNALANTLGVVVALNGVKAPSKFEPCNDISLSRQGRASVGQLRLPRTMTATRGGLTLFDRLSPQGAGGALVVPGWTCRQLPSWKSLLSPPLCQETSGAMDFSYTTQRAIDESNGQKVNPDLAYTYHVSARFVEKFAGPGATMESIETVSITGAPAVRSVFSYNGASGRRTAIMILRPTYGLFIVAYFTFPSSGGSSSLFQANQLLSQMRFESS